MFEQQYKQDNEHIQLSDEANERILCAIRQEEDKPVTAPPRRRVWPRVVAAAACVALLLGGVFAADRFFSFRLAPVVQSNRPELPVQTPAPTTSYADLFKLVETLQEESKTESNRGHIIFTDDAIDSSANLAVPESSPTIKGQYVTTYVTTYSGTTATNTQYVDVDEADIIKTDGRYVYILDRNEQRVTIAKVAGEQTAVVTHIDLAAEEDANFLDMYYVDDRLVVLYTDGMRWSNPHARVSDCVALSYTCVTRAAIYDVRDRTAPRLLTTLGQDGALLSSRMVDGVLYLVTNHSIFSDIDKDSPASYVPSLYKDDTAAPVKEASLCIAPDPDKTDYALVTASAVTGEVARLSEKAVFGSGSGIVYANTQHLLLATPHYEWTSTETPLEDNKVQYDHEATYSTSLTLFSIANGKVALLADTVIEGTLDGQFAIDEYNGYFRLAVSRFHTKSRSIARRRALGGESLVSGDSTNEEDNALYVLDGSLKEVGRVEDLAPDEQVKSVRFDGDIGYVVTFRQTDPLFAIDLSDPTAPKVLSALKITGFSEYLHPWADGRLLGFGHAGTEEGINGRLKLTMFNTEDKQNVTVQTALELPAAINYSEALYDHHAILVDSERAVVGFPVNFNDGYGYQLYTYTETDGFARVAQCVLPNGFESMRGIFIGEQFYLCHADGVLVYDADFTLLLELTF